MNTEEEDYDVMATIEAALRQPELSAAQWRDLGVLATFAEASEERTRPAGYFSAIATAIRTALETERR